MKAVYNFFIQTRIRLGLVLSLIFFALLIPACRQDKNEDISIEWKGNQATGINIPKGLLKDTDSLAQWLQVRVQGNKDPMLGNYNVESDRILFQPVVPLSRGLDYEILFQNKLIGKVKVPPADASNAPRLVAVYPSADTLPENLLKIYLQFSSAMREGEALRQIALLNKKGDTLPHVFLNLQQELWNKERTVLTVWLDPGRIKRDLIPNQEMGNPLQKGKRYTLVVSNKWKDVQGLELQQNFKRNFFANGRDDHSPELQSWQLQVPKASTTEPLLIHYGEPLDYYLLQETVSIRDERNNPVAGTFQIQNNETGMSFIPSNPWQTGTYKLKVATHLEDLAGNNLLQPFDRDIQQQTAGKELDFLEREFVINN